MGARVCLAVMGLLVVCACGPELTPPGAKGQISLLPGAATDGFTTIEIRMQEDGNGGDLNLVDIIKDGDQAKDRKALDKLPLKYAIEHDSESSAVEQWRLTVWLSKTEEADAPVVGDLVGTELFRLEDCTQLGGEEAFCGTTEKVDVLIEAIVQGG